VATSPFAQQDVQTALGRRFVLDRELRVGGQGVVYRARRIERPDGSACDELVALKVHTDPREDERVVREISAMTGVRHRCLASLIEHGVVRIAGNNTRYIAWEFISGTPLDARVRAGPINARAVAVVGRDVSLALSEVWIRRIVHRDVTPKNIILRDGEAEAVLLDLGAARHLNERTITGQGLTCGTPGYLSPEQSRADTRLTCASDVFSLGVTLQQCLIGRHPTGGNQNALNAGPPSTVQIAPMAPARLATLIDACLSLRAAFRPLPYQLAVALDAFLRS
jgi:serine/threonine protein kinase